MTQFGWQALGIGIALTVLCVGFALNVLPPQPLPAPAPEVGVITITRKYDPATVLPRCRGADVFFQPQLCERND